MNGEQLIILLRDCFTGGYTLPQFCFDNNIKKPLIVAEVKFWRFVWEIYVQFRCDKRLTAEFSLLDAPTDYFIRKTYAEIPLLNLLQRNPKVKLFLTNFPNINRYKEDANSING